MLNQIILILIAITPSVGVAVFIYIKDKYDPEPIRTLIKSFLMGFIAFGLTLLISLPIEGSIGLRDQNLTDQIFKAFFIVALIEELTKFIFARGFIFYHKDFDEPIDGIIYTVMIGMGFATVENILYIFYAEGGGTTGIIRMFTAIPAHAFFAILMGYFIGLAKYAPMGYSRLFSLLALIVAVLFHGLYDYFLFISFIPKVWIWSFVSLFVAFLFSGKVIYELQKGTLFKSKRARKNSEIQEIGTDSEHTDS